MHLGLFLLNRHLGWSLSIWPNHNPHWEQDWERAWVCSPFLSCLGSMKAGITACVAEPRFQSAPHQLFSREECIWAVETKDTLLGYLFKVLFFPFFKHEPWLFWNFYRPDWPQIQVCLPLQCWGWVKGCTTSRLPWCYLWSGYGKNVWGDLPPPSVKVHQEKRTCQRKTVWNSSCMMASFEIFGSGQSRAVEEG